MKTNKQKNSVLKSHSVLIFVCVCVCEMWSAVAMVTIAADLNINTAIKVLKK